MFFVFFSIKINIATKKLNIIQRTIIFRYVEEIARVGREHAL